MWLHAQPEADRVLCQLVMFLTAFFHWMNKMKYSCDQKSSVFQGWFVYWVFGWEMRCLSKSEIRFRMNSECCNADFWQVRRIGLSWNFKMLQWISLNESFRPSCIHYEDYVKRVKKIRSIRLRDIQKSAKSPNFIKMHLDRWWENGLVLRSHERKYAKISWHQNMILSSILRLLKNKLVHL